MNISELNLVNQKTKITPIHDLSGYETSITLYFSVHSDLIIIGEIDGYHICWVSSTKTYEKEKNEAIFNYIANEPISVVSNAQNIGLLTPDELKRYYRTELKRSARKGMKWETPFGHYYSEKSVQYHGHTFAGNVETFPNLLQKRCHFREMNGSYEVILDLWLAELSNKESDPLYYRTVEPLIEIMKNESYLVLSKNDAIREKYLLLCDKARNLYNRYMDATR